MKAKILQQTGLTEVFQEHHQMAPDSTTTTPGRFIDRVTTWGVELQRVTLIRANEPATSDHLAIVIDVNPQILGQLPFRKLTSIYYDAKRKRNDYINSKMS